MVTIRNNERKTEDIVRDHFRRYLENIVLEEQISDSPKINKILSNASKSGNGRGSPEFIIQFKNNSDLLIIVECKADVTKHESKNRDKYKDYSVDGILLYSSYLAKEFDVLSIVVSGQNVSELRVSHFLQLKNDKRAILKFSNKLLSISDYIEGYLKSPEKFRQDYNKLLDFQSYLMKNYMGIRLLKVIEDC